MDTIKKLYSGRVHESKSLITDTFRFQNNSVPFIINTANYFSFGYGDQIPKAYYTSGESMYRRQIEQFRSHYDLVCDDYVPYLMPWFGTGVMASGFGVDTVFNGRMDPTTGGFVINSVDEIDTLAVPDPYTDGFMPDVLDRIDWFRSHSKLPVCITDCQGPLTTAVQVCGYENTFYWFYDHPEAMHKLMRIVTDSLIKWIEAQKKHTGEPGNHCFGNQGVYVPEGVGVWLSDDDAILMPPDLYREFVAPYNDQIFEAFGGGVLHFCGTASQQIENFKSMKYLKGINNFALGNLKELVELKNALSGKTVVIACDFTPIEYKDYYTELFETLGVEREGLVIQSLFLPTIGLTEGRYEFIERDEKETVENLFRVLMGYCKPHENRK